MFTQVAHLNESGSIDLEMSHESEKAWVTKTQVFSLGVCFCLGVLVLTFFLLIPLHTKDLVGQSRSLHSDSHKQQGSLVPSCLVHLEKNVRVQTMKNGWFDFFFSLWMRKEPRKSPRDGFFLVKPLEKRKEGAAPVHHRVQRYPDPPITWKGGFMGRHATNGITSE